MRLSKGVTFCRWWAAPAAALLLAALGCAPPRAARVGLAILLEGGDEGSFPVKGGVTIDQDGRELSFLAVMEDAQGRPVRYLTQDGSPLSPALHVTDAAGKLVYTGVMSFG